MDGPAHCALMPLGQARCPALWTGGRFGRREGACCPFPACAAPDRGQSCSRVGNDVAEPQGFAVLNNPQPCVFNTLSAQPLSETVNLVMGLKISTAGRVQWLATAWLLAVACNPSDNPDLIGGSGGASSGGAAQASGGTLGAGGFSAGGTAFGAGGAGLSSGGQEALGGEGGEGGELASGGDEASGGTVSAGGSSGGAVGTGGEPATGGDASTGGETASGGETSSGGTGSGGEPASGGQTGTGGDEGACPLLQCPATPLPLDNCYTLSAYQGFNVSSCAGCTILLDGEDISDLCVGGFLPNQPAGPSVEFEIHGCTDAWVSLSCW